MRFHTIVFKSLRNLYSLANFQSHDQQENDPASWRAHYDISEPSREVLVLGATWIDSLDILCEYPTTLDILCEDPTKEPRTPVTKGRCMNPLSQVVEASLGFTSFFIFFRPIILIHTDPRLLIHLEFFL